MIYNIEYNTLEGLSIDLYDDIHWIWYQIV